MDESCYKEVENCHMMILIVGGRYGSLASEQKEKYEKQYISITRKEYETARQKGIPIMVFVEQNVFAEYKTYMANQNYLQTNLLHILSKQLVQQVAKIDAVLLGSNDL